jgi:hypothetical protein
MKRNLRELPSKRKHQHSNRISIKIQHTHGAISTFHLNQTKIYKEILSHLKNDIGIEFIHLSYLGTKKICDEYEVIIFGILVGERILFDENLDSIPQTNYVEPTFLGKNKTAQKYFNNIEKSNDFDLLSSLEIYGPIICLLKKIKFDGVYKTHKFKSFSNHTWNTFVESKEKCIRESPFSILFDIIEKLPEEEGEGEEDGLLMKEYEESLYGINGLWKQKE